jgi:predicted phosphodiesterase
MRFGLIVDPHLTNKVPSSRIDDYPQVMLAKMEDCRLIMSEEGVHATYCTGDIFNSKDISFEYLNKASDVFNRFGGTVRTIVGNHDIMFDRVDTLHRTPLGALLNMGTLGYLEHDTYTLDDGRKVNVFGVDYKCAIPPPIQGDINILVAHNSYGDCWGEKGIGDEELAGYQIAMLGHDHATYPISVTSSGCVLIRPGSISRGTAGEVDRTRIPQVAIVDLETLTAKYVTIPHRPEDEVFSKQAIQHNEMKGAVKDYVKSLSETSYAKGETVAELVTRYAEDPVVLRRVTEHLIKEGIL